MSGHPTSKARRKRQKIKRKYARLREDCQLACIIETTPEGAVRDERVPPSAQAEDSRGLPSLVMAASSFAGSTNHLESNPPLATQFGRRSRRHGILTVLETE